MREAQEYRGARSVAVGSCIVPPGNAEGLSVSLEGRIVSCQKPLTSCPNRTTACGLNSNRKGVFRMPDLTVTNWFGDLVWHPQAIVEAHSVNDIVNVVKNPSKYPSPLRAIGSSHSTARCAVADGG